MLLLSLLLLPLGGPGSESECLLRHIVFYLVCVRLFCSIRLLLRRQHLASRTHLVLTALRIPAQGTFGPNRSKVCCTVLAEQPGRPKTSTGRSNGTTSQVTFVYGMGPLAWSIIAFRNSLVFHSLDKVQPRSSPCLVLALGFPTEHSELRMAGLADHLSLPALVPCGGRVDAAMAPRCPYRGGHQGGPGADGRVGPRNPAPAGLLPDAAIPRLGHCILCQGKHAQHRLLLSGCSS